MMYHTRTYNAARLPSIANYDMAKRIYEEVKPIRGRYPEERPLGKNRRYTWMQIHKRHSSVESEDNPLGEFVTSYACHLYSTDCIEFFPNNEIVLRINGWKGPTTMMFLNYTLKEYIGEVQSEKGKWYFVNKGGEAFVFPTSKDQELRMHFVEGHGFRPMNLEPEYKYKVRRKEMNKLRKYYSDFIEYGKTMLMADSKLGTWDDVRNLRNELGFQTDSFCGYHEYGRYGNDGNKLIVISIAEQRNRLMRMVQDAMEKNDLELKHKLLYTIASNVARYEYGGRLYFADPTRFVQGFEEIMKYHHHEVIFEKIEQEVGVPFNDHNDRYINV